MGTGTVRRNLGNIIIAAGSVGAAWSTWWDLHAAAWPGHGWGLWRLLFTCLYFAAGWRIRTLLGSRTRSGDVLFVLGASVATATIIADVGTGHFDAMPGPDLLDAYLLQGTIFAGVWWLQAVTNADFRRMCGWTVVIGAGVYRLLLWPYVAYTALA